MFNVSTLLVVCKHAHLLYDRKWSVRTETCNSGNFNYQILNFDVNKFLQSVGHAWAGPKYVATVQLAS